MQGWRLFWTVFCAVGFVAFAGLVIMIVPRGALELKEFFARLTTESDTLARDESE